MRTGNIDTTREIVETTSIDNETAGCLLFEKK